MFFAIKVSSDRIGNPYKRNRQELNPGSGFYISEVVSVGGKREYGFTLVELMIVISVIAILAGIAVPGIMSWLPNYRLKAAARDLYSNLQKVKLMAIKTQSEHAVFFDTAAGSYQILSDPGFDVTWGTTDDTDDNPGPDGIYGNADDIPEKLPLFLAAYGSGVGYGYGNATKKATVAEGPISPGDEVSYAKKTVVFNSRGMLRSAPGYVYFSNNVASSYVVGTPTFIGNVVLKKWFAPSAAWD